MKNMRKLFAVALLVLTLGLPVYADGQMETPRTVTSTTEGQMETPLLQEDQTENAQAKDGQMETPLTIVLMLLDNALALI